MKLIAIDLDGTLLATDHSISEENKAAIKKAQAANHMVVISTGRALHDTQHILKKAGLQCPIMTGNGSISYHDKKIIRRLEIPAHSLKEIVTVLDNHSLYYEIYGSEGLYFLANGRQILTAEVEYLQQCDPTFSTEFGSYIIERQHQQKGWTYLKSKDTQYLTDLQVYKIYCYSFNKQMIQKAQARLAQNTDFSIIISEKNSFEVVNKEANKGAALLHLAQHLNISPEQIVAIGDNYNDLAMFKVAKVSIAMGNADEEIKNQCTTTTYTNDEHGVAHGIEQYILK